MKEKYDSSVLNVRVRTTLAEKAELIGRGNKTRGVVTALEAFKIGGIPQAAPTADFKDLVNRISAVARFSEETVSTCSQMMDTAAARLSSTVTEVSTALRSATQPMKATLTERPTVRELCIKRQETLERQPEEEPLTYLIRLHNLSDAHVEECTAWRHSGLYEYPGDDEHWDSEYQTLNDAMVKAEAAYAARLSKQPQPPVQVQAVGVRDTKGLSPTDRELLAQAKLAEGVDIHGNMVELASRVRQWEAQAAASLGVAQRLVSWFEEHRLCLEKGVTFEDLKERVECANTEIEAQLEANSSLASLPHIDTDKGLVFTDAQLAEALRLA